MPIHGFLKRVRPWPLSSHLVILAINHAYLKSSEDKLVA